MAQPPTLAQLFHNYQQFHQSNIIGISQEEAAKTHHPRYTTHLHHTIICNRQQWLSMILESLTENYNRQEVGRWVISTVDEGEFDIEQQGAMNDLLEKLKKKFEVPNWRKCGEIWRQIITFKRHENKNPKDYIQRW